MNFQSSLCFCLSLLFAGCSETSNLLRSKTIPSTPVVLDTPTAQKPDSTTLRPKPRPPLRVATNATGITVAELSTTSPAELAKATKPTIRPEQDLGTTIASLGILDRNGFWLKTALVKSETQGRVVYLKNEKAINLTLVPSNGPPGSGSQISITSMQILGIPLTELAEVQVFIR